MPGFILHSLDCTDIAMRIEVSHPGSLIKPDEGYAWFEVPLPASAWTVVLNGEGKPEKAPFVRDAEAQLTLAKIAARQAVKALQSIKYAQGYLVAGTGTDLDGQRLEVRDGTNDRTNWLTSKSAYGDAVAAGAGDVPGALFKTATNQSFTLTFAQGLAVLTGMQAWGFEVMQIGWAKTDAIDAATDQAALDLVDIEAGWP